MLSMLYVANIWCNQCFQCLIGVSILNYILRIWYDRYWRVKSFFSSVNVFDVNSTITFFSWWISHSCLLLESVFQFFPDADDKVHAFKYLGSTPFVLLKVLLLVAVDSGLISWVLIPWSPLRALIKLTSVHAQNGNKGQSFDNNKSI